MDANRPVPGPGGYGGLGAGSIVSKNIQPLLDSDPRQIGPYAVRGRLGQGAMGHVFLGFAPTGQAFALKVLRPDFAADRDFRRRFTREIAAARAVHSPFVNAVTDADPNAATPWLASYFIPGPPLSAAVQLAGPFAPRSVAHLGVGIGLALQAIHTAGIVHRDLKPANVLVASDGPRVIDFGIARATDASMLTSTGMRLGTPSFMAPEQVAGTDVEAPADVWAVGGMLIYAATGRTPFGDGNAMAVLYRVEHHEPDLEGLEPALAHIVSRCLAKDPAARPTPAQLVEMCRAALGGGLEGLPALRGTDVTGWLPPAVSRDLAARAVELANVGYAVAPAAGAAAGMAGDNTGTGSAGNPAKGGGLGGFLRRKGGGQPQSAPATGASAQHGQPSGQYSQGAAMVGGQDQHGPGPQAFGGPDPSGTGGQYAGPGGTGQVPPAQYGTQQPGAFGGQNPGTTGGQYGAPGPQGGFGTPAAPGTPAWGPSGPSGSDMPTIITTPVAPPTTPTPEPQGPAWRVATATNTPATPEPAPEPEPEPVPTGPIAGLPAGFTPIGEEAKKLAAPTESPDLTATTNVEAAEPAFSQPPVDGGSSGFGQAARVEASSAAGDAFSAAADVEAAFGPAKSSPGVPPIAEPTFATTFNVPAVTPAPEPVSEPEPAVPAASGAGVPSIAEPTFATTFNVPAVTPASEAETASEPEPAAPASSGVSVPSIAPPSLATNFTPSAVAPTSDPNASTQPTPTPAVGVPQIAEPTFATNFNLPLVTPAAGGESDESEAAAPSAPPAVSIPQIAEPTFATNFNIPVVTATEPSDDAANPAASAAPPAVGVPSIAAPAFATGFGIPAVTPDAAPTAPVETDRAPAPITHAPPIPPHLQQPMTPPKGFGAPAQQPQPQSQPSATAPAQQPQAPAPPQTIPHQQPYAAPGYAPQPQPPYAQLPQPNAAPGYPPQPPMPPHPQPQPQPPYNAPHPGAGYQPQPAAYAQNPNQNQNQGQFPQNGMTMVPPPPSMSSPYGAPERAPGFPGANLGAPAGNRSYPAGPKPTLHDTDAVTGWAVWPRNKRIAVMAGAGAVLVTAVVGAILAFSGGGGSPKPNPTATAVPPANAGSVPGPATSSQPPAAAPSGPIGAQQGAAGAKDVVLRGLYMAAAAHDFHTVCVSQTLAAQKGAAKSGGWNGQGDPLPVCQKYFQDNWSAIDADYLRTRQVTAVKPGSNPTSMVVTVNDPPASGGGTTRNFTVVWQDNHWLLEAARG